MATKFTFKYVLSELLIVIAGILIAFTLNNWAQSRSDKKQEQIYFQSLKSDIEADLVTLKKGKDFLTQRIKIAQGIMAHFRTTLPGRDTIPMTIFRELRGAPPFVSHDITYQMLINSGDFQLISNFDTRNKIVEHYASYQVLYDENKRSDAFIREHVSPFFMNVADFEDMERDAEKLLQDHRLRNIVYAWFGIFQIQSRVHEQAIARCEQMARALE
ncbi:MAG: hypothetical protein KF852_07985 [Saprospiraceae bacterium]|nr:hypothetical protein [Saprospiraceae bacterium]